VSPDDFIVIVDPIAGGAANVAVIDHPAGRLK
jgi:hypothetical protein